MDNISYLNKHERSLMHRLNFLRSFLNFNFLFQQYSTSSQITKKYYRATRIPFYRIFCSKRGFMHIGLSFDNSYTKNDKYEYTQAKIVSKYLKKFSSGKILEIGCGQGTNIHYLSQKFPSLDFVGVDLIPGFKLYKHSQSNMVFIEDDYHKLSCIPNASIDVVFAIETICYSTQKEKLFHLLYEKLKPNGILIIFDGYSCKKRCNYSQVERLCLDILENAYHIHQFEYVRDVEHAMKIVGFSKVLSKNLDRYTFPYFSDVEKRIQHFCSLGFLLKIALKLTSTEITGSMVPGYILGEMVRSKIVCYMLHILEKEG